MNNEDTTIRLTARFSEALAYTADLHRHQRRKGGEIPYVGHLLSVAGLVIEGDGTETQVIAALLHDAVEDQGRDGETLREIGTRFGADVARIVEIWESCRARTATPGPFLFGAFSIADGMFAPVVWRFETYAVDLPPAARSYADAMLALPAMQEWAAAARAEIG